MRTSAFLLAPPSPTLALLVATIALPAGAEARHSRDGTDMIDGPAPINRPNGPVGDPPRRQTGRKSIRLRRRRGGRRGVGIWRGGGGRRRIAGGGGAARRPPRDPGIADRRERPADPRLPLGTELNSPPASPCRARSKQGSSERQRCPFSCRLHWPPLPPGGAGAGSSP